MSKTSKSVLVFAVAFGGIISLNAQTTLLDMTFDNPSTPGMSTDYIQNTAPGTPGNFNTPYGTSVNATLTTFSEQPGVGVYEGGSPSGGIAVAGGDGDAVYSGTGFDFSQAGEWMQLSMMLYTPANGTLTGSGDKFQLGLAYDTQDAPFGGALGNGIINSFASYRLLSVQSTLQYTLEYQNDTGGGSSTQGSGLQTYTLTANEWYQMSILYVNDGGGQMTESVGFYDCGPQGTSTPTLVNVGYSDQFTFASPLTGDSTVEPEFRDSTTTGLDDLDNLDLVIPAPEPQTLAILGVSALFALNSYRLRRK